MGRGLLAGLAIVSLLTIVGGLALSAFTSQSQAYLKVDYEGEVIRDQRYGEAERNLYDLYLPEDTSSGKAAHLVLFIHGGGWTSGDKEDGEAWCRYYAARGYVAASMSYTLLDEEHWPSILSVNDEVIAAVKAIKARCAQEDMGIRLRDMAVQGFSAGACQAMMFGFREKERSETDPDLLPVRFIVQQSGPSTFDPAVWGANGQVMSLVRKATGLDGTAKGEASFISLFSGQYVTADMVREGTAEAAWKAASPYSYITEDSVPILYAYGANDNIVPPASRMILENALKAAGKREYVDYVGILMERSGHGLSLDPDQQQVFLSAVRAFCDRYFTE
ncbi:MAG: alpha/beta hydrolase [Spirochaetales bacterium]|nr:alpha/beta hydrolase [Spirochaetales bacterium]